MIISHRGNTAGPNPAKENHPDTILNLLEQKVYVEVDIWHINKMYYLGHDSAVYACPKEIIASRYSVLHCKNIEAFLEMYNSDNPSDSFYHSTEELVLTNHRKLWFYPRRDLSKVPNNESSVIVLPEYYNLTREEIGNRSVCTDYTQKYETTAKTA